MKYNVTVGSHVALVDLTLDGKGAFTGVITSKDFGIGKVAGIQTGDHLTGSASLDGHSAKFDATISESAINGTLTAGWFFHEDFQGTAA